MGEKAIFIPYSFIANEPGPLTCKEFSPHHTGRPLRLLRSSKDPFWKIKLNVNIASEMNQMIEMGDQCYTLDNILLHNIRV